MPQLSHRPGRGETFFFFILFCPFSFFSSQSTNPSLTLCLSPSPHSLFMCSLLSSVFLPISLSPQGQQFRIQALLSLSLCYNFKQCRRSGHAVVPGASVTVPSQVYISQRVLDDTLSLSPILLLLISVVSSGGSKDSWATFTNYQPTPCYLCSGDSVFLTSAAGKTKIITRELVRMIVLIFPLKEGIRKCFPESEISIW